METRNHQQVLQFALNHERGQDNQRAINTQMKGPSPIPYNQISYIAPNLRNQANNQTLRPLIPTRNFQPPRNTTTPNPCRRCGIQLTPENLQICPAKRIQCHFTKKKLDTTAKCADQQNFVADPTDYTPAKHPSKPQSTKHKSNNTKPTYTHSKPRHPTGQ